MFKLIFWLIVFVILFILFPKIVGSFILLAIVVWIGDEFVTEGF